MRVNTRFISLRVKLVVGFTLIFTLVSAVTFYWFYQFSTNRVLAEIEEQMVDTIQGAIHHIDGDEFAALVRMAEAGAGDPPADNPRYRDHQGWLETIHAVEPRAFPYSFARGEEPYEIFWIGDIFRSIRPEDGTRFGERYYADPERTQLYQGFDGFTTALIPYEDPWGTWVSAFAPIRNSQGEVVGGLGLDYSASHLQEVQQGIRNRVLLAFVLTYCVLVILVWLVANTVTRSIMNLQKVAEAIGAGDYDPDFTGVVQYSFPDEIATLSEVFELMVGKVRAREERLKQQVEELTIVIDESKREKQVSEIVESNFFQDLQDKANRLRRKNAGPDTADTSPASTPAASTPAASSLSESSGPHRAHTEGRDSSSSGSSGGNDGEDASPPAGRYADLLDTLEALPQVAGVTTADILYLAEPFDALLGAIIRQGSMTLAQLAAQLELTPEQAQHVGERLVAKGYLQMETADPSQTESDAGPIYRIYYARLRRQNLPSELL